MSKVQKKSRGWTFTVNNYTEADIDSIPIFAQKCRYLVYGLEVGESGTPHIQGYCYFAGLQVFSRLKKQFPTGHIEAARGSPLQNKDYCTKDGKFTQFGDLPSQGSRGDLSEFTLAVQSSREKLDEETLLLQYSSIVARYPEYVNRVQRYFHRPVDLEKLDNHWYYGPAGTGKTYSACQLGTYYIKAPNKWFCGYTDEDVIIVEDIEPKHAAFISWFLKIWGDYRPFTAQVKGSSMLIRPPTIVVTSNYSIAEMGWDEVTQEAITRRFTPKKFSQKFIYPEGGVRS